MKKATISACVLLFLLALALPTLYFYRGVYGATPVPRPHPEDIPLGSSSSAGFTDTPQERTGTLLIDRSHGNQFAPTELSLFIQRVLARGYNVDYLESREKEKVEELRTRLEERLRLADALAVILPRVSFAAKEAELIGGFVARGGKLLLIADPTRHSAINSVANRLGITFQDDYLYNLKENDGNFRNIFVSQFKEGDVTKGLKRVVLYAASSITPSAWGLAFTDKNTSSSLIGSSEAFSPLLLSQDNRVLAVADLSFMKEPYIAAHDNNYLLSNIVDWLTLSERRFSLTDFPYFFRDKVGIEVADSKLLDPGLRLKSLLERAGKSSQLSEFKGKFGNRVFLGLLTHAEKVKSDLAAGSISVSTDNKTVSIKIGDIGEVYKPDTALLYLYGRATEKSLILLADKEEGLKPLIDSLETGEFRQWLVTDDLALYYPKGRPVEKK